jgi:hypothetical protein
MATCEARGALDVGDSGHAAAVTGCAESGAAETWAAKAQGPPALRLFVGAVLPSSTAANTGPCPVQITILVGLAFAPPAIM